jgi:hypothetical protein
MTEYKLKTPIILGEETVEVLKLEEPTIEKLKKFNVDLSQEALELSEGMFRIICACVTNVSEAHVNKMKMRDMVRCMKECVGFFSEGAKEAPQ